MACLKLIKKSGSEEIIPLSKKEPITIGQHSSNTIAVDAPDIPILYARILWNKRSKGYEIAAASLDDIVISGEGIRSAMLKDGDDFDFADMKIIFLDEDLPGQPGSENKPEETSNKEDSDSSKKSSKKKKEKKKSEKEAADPKDKEEKKPEVKKEGITLTKSQQSGGEATVSEWVKKARRPGERNAARSPLITSLVFVTLLLGLAAGGFYLMIGRQSAQRAYQEAKANRDEGKYAQSIQLYSKFLSDFSSHKLADKARVELSLSEIDRALSGAGNDLTLALQAVEDFVSQHRQRENYRDWYPLLTVYSSRISIQSYRLARRKHNPKHLVTGDKAKQLFAGFKASDGSNEDNAQEIEQESKQARAELLEFDVQQKTLAKMDQALKQKKVASVLKNYREAAVRYPQFGTKKEFVTRIVKTLETEKQSIVTKLYSEKEPYEAPKQNKTKTSHFGQPTILASRDFSKFEIKSDGQHVWFLVDGDFYAVDRMLGELRWHKNIGQPIAFEPLTVIANYESWLVSSRNATAVSLLKQEDGTQIWEAVFDAQIASAPVISGGMLYVLTNNRKLYAIETETGNFIGQITLPRNISAPICPLGNDEILCVGEEDVFYFINRQTWTCSAVKYDGHAMGTITQQPLMVTDRLVVLENDQLKNGRMKVLQLKDDGWKLKQLQTVRLAGASSGTPLLWGDRLFLKTDHPAISAWHLSDAVGENLLTKITNTPIPFAPDTKIFIQPFEGDRLLLAGESLREFTLQTNSFEQKDLAVKLGAATQSLQLYGTNLSVPGEMAQEKGRAFLHYNFDLSESFWRLRLSCDPQLLLRRQPNSPAVRCLDSSANLFDVSQTKSVSNIKYAEPIERIIDPPFSVENPLKTGRVLDPKMIVISAGQEVRSLNAYGQTLRTLRLAGKSDLTAATNEILFWGNQAGIHATSWDSGAAAASSWLKPVKKADQKKPELKYEWTDLVPVDNQTLLAVSQAQTVMGLKIREDPRRHLAETDVLQLEAKAIGAGDYDNALYWLALRDGSCIAIDARSLLIRQQTKLKATPTAGPWAIGSAVYVELAGNQLVSQDKADVKKANWSLPLQGSPLSTAPFLLNDQHLFVCNNEGIYFVVEVATGKIIANRSLPSAISCQPLLIDQTLHLGLKTGAVLSIPLAQLLQKP